MKKNSNLELTIIKTLDKNDFHSFSKSSYSSGNSSSVQKLDDNDWANKHLKNKIFGYDKRYIVVLLKKQKNYISNDDFPNLDSSKIAQIFRRIYSEKNSNTIQVKLNSFPKATSATILLMPNSFALFSKCSTNMF